MSAPSDHSRNARRSSGLTRRDFLATAGKGAALGLMGAVPSAAALEPTREPRVMRMAAGHQHDHSPSTLKLLAALGVTRICSGLPSAKMDERWSVGGLTTLRQDVESYGISLDCVPLPLSSRDITKAEYPEILLAKDPERERALDDLCEMIRNAGAAGIPMVKYNLTLLGVVRTERVKSRGGASSAAFEYALSDTRAPGTAGNVSEEIYWDRITYFLRKVVPVAEEAKVKLALHPQDPGLPAGSSFHGVQAVLANPDGLKRFVDIQPSEFHGLNFCQGTISEMLTDPNREIHDLIRWFGRRGKIFNVHFRNIRGGLLKFNETFPDDGDVDMPQALRTYREVGYAGMVMPDHVPSIEGDADHYRAFSFCFGYIQALLQVLRTER
ncbi:MAG: mannonate dehydratase [Opitutus sp.]